MFLSFHRQRSTERATDRNPTIDGAFRPNEQNPLFYCTWILLEVHPESTRAGPFSAKEERKRAVTSAENMHNENPNIFIWRMCMKITSLLLSSLDTAAFCGQLSSDFCLKHIYVKFKTLWHSHWLDFTQIKSFSLRSSDPGCDEINE